MAKIKVEKVEIKIGKRTVWLTPDEARTLRDELSELLGDRWVAPYYYPPTIWIPIRHEPWITYTTDNTKTISSGTVTSSGVVYADDSRYYDEMHGRWVNEMS